MSTGGDSQSGGGKGGGRGRGRGRGPGGGRPKGGAPRPKPAQGAGGNPGRRPGPQGGQQTPPIEIAVRSSRNAVKRHADGLRDDQVRLACRAVLIALHGNLGAVENPGELLGVVEQVQHVLHAGAKESAQLPVALRAVVAFSLEDPRRTREVQEMLRLMLRHLYALCSDFVPRQARDDAKFRASAVLDVIGEIARVYLDDAKFDALRG